MRTRSRLSPAIVVGWTAQLALTMGVASCADRRTAEAKTPAVPAPSTQVVAQTAPAPASVPVGPASCGASGPGLTDCGSGAEGCCASLDVPAGAFYRIYHPSPDAKAARLSPSRPAAVGAFRLDKYPVTVGRFRRFVAAWKQGKGWTPGAGSGKHTHLNGGSGLSAYVGRFEPGWEAKDTAEVAPTDENLACDGLPTWTPVAADHEKLPINCVTWFEAQAFCIWDGGFLPSATEWEYAAAGGEQQRRYPWGSTEPGTSNQYAIYDCLYPSGSSDCEGAHRVAAVGHAVAGAGRWGHLDLVGEVRQWTLDRDSPMSVPCWDCAKLDEGDNRVTAGAAFSESSAEALPFGNRDSAAPSERSDEIGIRCGGTPDAMGGPVAASSASPPAPTAVAPAPAPAPVRTKVSGRLTVGGKSVALRAFLARTSLDPFDDTKDTEVLFTDRPVTVDQFREHELNDLAKQGKLNGLLVGFGQWGQCERLVVLGVEQSSGNGVCQFTAERFELLAIAGRAVREKGEGIKSPYSFDVRFEGPVRDTATIPVDEVSGTPLTDGGGDPGKCFFEYDAAIRSKDIPKILPLVSAAMAKALARPDGAKMLDAINALRPALTRVVRGYERGSHATLWVEAPSKTPGDGADLVRVTMARAGERWVLEDEVIH